MVIDDVSHAHKVKSKLPGLCLDRQCFR